MSDRTRHLYLIVPLLWILLFGAVLLVAYARTTGQPAPHSQNGHDHTRHSEVPAIPVALPQMQRARPLAVLADHPPGGC